MSPATGHRTVRRRPGDWDDVDTVLRVGLGAALVLMMGSVGQIISQTPQPTQGSCTTGDLRRLPSGA